MLCPVMFCSVFGTIQHTSSNQFTNTLFLRYSSESWLNTWIKPQTISTAHTFILVSFVCFHLSRNEELQLCCVHSKVLAEQNSSWNISAFEMWSSSLLIPSMNIVCRELFPLSSRELTQALLPVSLQRTGTRVADRGALQIARGHFCIASAAAVISFLNFSLRMGCSSLKGKQFC